MPKLRIDTLVELDRYSFIQHALAVGLTSNLAYRLWRQMGGQIRRSEWVQAWHAEEARRGAWESGAA